MVGYYREGVVGLKKRLGMGEMLCCCEGKTGGVPAEYCTVPALQTSAQARLRRNS